MVYRPTVRYHDVFQKYVDDVFKVTSLDRNQIIRAALFTAAYSSQFHQLMKPYFYDQEEREDVPLPQPKWSLREAKYWLEQNAEIYGQNAVKDVPTPDLQPQGEGRRIEVRNQGAIRASLLPYS
ncbi:hypothetical protein [Sutcliffiella sp. FSL R7-0096]|uniref:hypothetical protein n=1 Tax=Sutcliffiella sp. FSL R7-0096 TaxID=2921670 RepID=UPI00315ABDC7